MIRVWDAQHPIEPDFESAWRERVTSSAHAHFGFDLQWMIDQSRREPMLAVLAEQEGREGALVLRRVGGNLVCGWPWRAHVLVNHADPLLAGIDSEVAAWAFAVAGSVAGSRRLRLYVPEVAPFTPSFAAGATCLHDLSPSEAALLGALDSAKRRMIRKAERLGYVVREANGATDLRAFAELQRDTEARRGTELAPVPDEAAPGESWREWELPWMQLLVAEREGVIEGGSGFGFFPGSTIDYRTNASSEAGRRDGVNVLLAWEAIRRSKMAGFRWLNWCGATRFKRELGGTEIPMACWLGGGVAWALPNLITASRERTRAGAGRWVKRMTRERTRGNAAPAAGDAARPAESAVARPAESASGPKPVIRSSAGAGVVAAWSSREAARPEFDVTWNRVLGHCSRANFSLDLEFVRWEARHGMHSRAVLLEHDGRHALAVLRERGGEFVCGWPWRWQATFEDVPGESTGLGVAAEEHAWLFHALHRFAQGRRLRCFLPSPPSDHTPAFVAGATIVQSLRHSDEELLKAMSDSKRRMIRRARAEGYHIEEASTLEHLRAFAEVQMETLVRRGETPPRLAEQPEAGEAWREWELPWMWLLVAVREGRVESGLGDGIRAGAFLEGRAGASTLRARKDGAFALLCHEEARRGRDRGGVWLNHGGDTPFKRETAGRLGMVVGLHCWLGGGSSWAFANTTEAWAGRVRPQIRTWARTLFTRKGAA